MLLTSASTPATRRSSLVSLQGPRASGSPSLSAKFRASLLAFRFPLPARAGLGSCGDALRSPPSGGLPRWQSVGWPSAREAAGYQPPLIPLEHFVGDVCPDSEPAYHDIPRGSDLTREGRQLHRPIILGSRGSMDPGPDGTSPWSRTPRSWDSPEMLSTASALTHSPGISPKAPSST